jgi:uncharacterized Tic20 family protein
MSVADELQKLEELHRSGAISSDEFTSAKAKLLSGQPESLEQQTREWAMLLHLSLLAGFVLPLAGLVVPIVIWQWKKSELPGIDVHGKNALNWIISEIIYVAISVMLVFVIIGIPMLIALGLVAVIFPIIAGIKANNGEVWKYPLTITFFN